MAVKIDEAKKGALISELAEIKSKAKNGEASSSDISRAANIGADLGGKYSNAGSEVESLVKKAAEASQKSSSSSAKNDPKDAVEAAKEYFNREDVKKSEQELEFIKNGGRLNNDAFANLKNKLISKETEEEEKRILSDLEQKAKTIPKKAIAEGKDAMSREHNAELDEVNSKRKPLMRRQELREYLRTTTDKDQQKGAEEMQKAFDALIDKKLEKEKSIFNETIKEVKRDYSENQKGSSLSNSIRVNTNSSIRYAEDPLKSPTTPNAKARGQEATREKG